MNCIITQAHKDIILLGTLERVSLLCLKKWQNCIGYDNMDFNKV